jgi:hypothetical protein
MRLSFVNASPKPNKSTSGLFLQYLKTKLSSNAKIEEFHISSQGLSTEEIEKILDVDAVIFALPIYMGSLPSHLLYSLFQIQNYARGKANKKTVIYTIVNGGFYEGEHSKIAIDMMKHWCKKTGLTWGQALGSGAGDMYGSIPKLPIGKGPSINVEKALDEIAKTINGLNCGKNIIVSPNIPRFAWKMGALILVWNKRAKANGLSKKDLYYKERELV